MARKRTINIAGQQVTYIPPRTTFGKLSRKTRDRYAEIGAQFGLNRRQTREQYNRGTFRAGAKNPDDRLPLKLRRHPELIPATAIAGGLVPPSVQPRLPAPAEVDEIDVLRAMVIAHANNLLGDLPRYRADKFARRVEGFDEETLHALLATPDTESWVTNAARQPDPSIASNPRWYH